MAKYNNKRCLSLAQQQMRLQQAYPDLLESIRIRRSELNCIIRLQPTAESIEYRVKIAFKLGYWPTARLIEPKEIAKVDGEKPHHLFNRDKDGKEKLCVFHTKTHEWNDNMFLADAFIPWIITWQNDQITSYKCLLFCILFCLHIYFFKINTICWTAICFQLIE